MAWMSNKCLIKLLLHKQGECSESFQHKWEFHYAETLFHWSKFKSSSYLPRDSVVTAKVSSFICAAHSIGLIFSIATLLDLFPCFKTLSGSPLPLNIIRVLCWVLRTLLNLALACYSNLRPCCVSPQALQSSHMNLIAIPQMHCSASANCLSLTFSSTQSHKASDG